MTAFTEKLDRAAGAALCEGLQVAGGALIGAGAVSLVAGGAGVVPIALGSASLMAAAAGCNWNPNDGSPTDPAGPEICWKGGSSFRLIQLVNGEPDAGGTPEIAEVTGQSTEPAGSGSSNLGLYIVIYQWVTEGGSTGQTSMFYGRSDNGTVYKVDQAFTGDDTCDQPSPPPPEPDVPPYEYTDPVDGCSLTVNLKGFSTDETGAVNPVFKIEPSAQFRTDDPVIGGCNFSPVIYTGGPGGPGEPPIIRPWDPGWDDPFGGEPPWAELLREIAAGIAGNVISNELANLLAPSFPPSKYELFSICEVGSDGKPEQRVIEVEIPPIKGLQAAISRIDALVPLLQGQKDFKQPVCPPVKAEGEFRTIGFISENYSPNGRNYLRKRLRYRSVSGIGLDGLIDHWKDFRFEAGPVVVKHRGASWGTITVWAASADEGKRVIRHAAAEAAIDADSTGRWEISGSSSTRLGMPGTMKVNDAGGYYWITARDGASARPLVGQT